MKILLVEDDKRLADLLTKALGHHNHLVDWVMDGQSGWDYAEAGSYDLVLLDINLPKLDGISLCQRLRSGGYQQPILMLTARDDKSDRVQGLDAGADDYVVKPFDIEELLARIRALSRRGQAVTSTVLEWGHLRLDPVSCQVSYHQTLLPLTPKEYSLLELFLRNENRVFSLSSILDQLWSMEDSPGEETVRVHIRGLRQKLKNAGASPKLIETVYGLGYRLGSLPKSDVPTVSEVTSGSKTSKVTEPGKKTQDDMREALAQAWQQFQSVTLQQAERLQSAITAWSQATVEERDAARQDAHQLSGLLGTYGLPEGSRVARQILKILSRSEATLPTRDAKQLRRFAHRLQQIVAGESVTSQETMETTVLLISSDPSLTAKLGSWLTPWSIELEFEATGQVQDVIQVLDPALILIDLAEGTARSVTLALEWYQDLQVTLEQELPAVIALIEGPDSVEPLQALVQAGVTDFMLKPLNPPEAVTRILCALKLIP